MSENLAMSKPIYKIAITGGPCAGKTSFIPKAAEMLESLGYTVFVIDEVVTDLFDSGVVRSERIENRLFVEAVLKKQIQDERFYMEVAERMAGESPVVILCDRGVPDGRSYFDDYISFDKWLNNLGTTFDRARDSYDGVIHMVTAADGAMDSYVLDNKARFEEPDEAIMQDRMIFAQWSGHKNLRIVDSNSSFEEKMQLALQILQEMVQGLDENASK